MSRYTPADFEAVGLTPESCDYSALSGYFFPCSYHQGYVDGYDAGRQREQRDEARREDVREQMRDGLL